MSEHRRRLAYQAGIKAQRDGRSRASCNRERGTIFFDDWQDGYDAAEQDQP